MSPACGLTVEGIVRTCPRCGGPMRTSRMIRTFGWIMLTPGAAGLLVSAWMGLTMIGRGNLAETPSEAVAGLAAVEIVLVSFFLLGSVNALYMAVTGRTNRTLVRLMLRAVTILIVCAVVSRLVVRLLR
jgi:hypothetical protein